MTSFQEKRTSYKNETQGHSCYASKKMADQFYLAQDTQFPSYARPSLFGGPGYVKYHFKFVGQARANPGHVLSPYRLCSLS